MTRPYLDFYEQNQIIPVRQDLSDMGQHFARRQALYRHLGLLPALVRGRQVLEIGPGTGDNALHTASLAPARYVMVDGNPHSIKALAAKQADGLFGAVDVEVRQGNVLEMDIPERFDVVLCEGLLPPQQDPVGFLNHIARLVAADGVLVVTTMSHTSLLAETCRRTLRPLFERGDGLPALAGRMAAFFRPDLLSLPGMSRLHEDWVTDQILHPYGRNIAFTLEDVARTLGAGFDTVGTSPRLLQDWRWYKSVPESTQTEWERVADQLAGWSLSLIDYRLPPVAVDPALGRRVEALCGEAWDIHLDLKDLGDTAVLTAFLDKVVTIRDLLPAHWAPTAAALSAFLTGAPRLWRGEADELRAFRSLFGRGQQYLMATRAAPTGG
ncbi:bifunctional 2-polyprenyl-6-hydroxyphenol methylase/3-demethylubiquinol 3-O-methyltransferase UbiG [Azospirillum sp. B4]|uniref:class I SAM-dependent methyltransferase n=1 Tax=Azospirillum sp. B4 TaxID=95605 RepID=UPI000345F0B4|nr:class I SAM-dependent methyltransferase [Azospirillum sp. B4]